MAANLGSIFGRINIDTTGLKRGLAQSRKQLTSFTTKTEFSMKRVAGSMAGVVRKLTNIRTLMAAGGAIAVGMFAKSAIREAAAYETELTKVATLVDDTNRVFGEFSDGITDLSISFGQSKTTLTKGMFDIISATIDASEAMEVLEASTKLAVGGFTEAGTATQAIITTFQTFTRQIKSAADASDFLFTIQKRGRLTVADVAETFGVVAASAKAVGITVEDLGTAFAAISRSGIGAQRTVVQLQRFLDTFIEPGKEATDIAARYGVELGLSAIQGDRLIKTIQRLSKMTAEESAIVFKEVRARRAFNALVAQGNSLLDDHAELSNRAGNTQIALGKAMETAAIKFAKLHESVLLLKKALGEGLVDALLEVTEDTTKWIKTMKETGAIDEFSDKVKTLTKLMLSLSKIITVPLKPFFNYGAAFVDVITTDIRDVIPRLKGELKGMFNDIAKGLQITFFPESLIDTKDLDDQIVKLNKQVRDKMQKRQEFFLKIIPRIEFRDADLQKQVRDLLIPSRLGVVGEMITLFPSLERDRKRIENVEEAFKKLGIVSDKILNKMAGSAFKNFEIIGKQGELTTNRLAEVWRVLKEKIDTSRLFGSYKEEFDELEKQFGSLTEDMIKDIDKLKQSTLTPFEELTEGINKIQELVKASTGTEFEISTETAQKAIEKLTDSYLEFRRAVEASAQALKDSLRTPLEVMQDSIKALNQMRKESPLIIDDETFGRAMEKIASDYKTSLENMNKSTKLWEKITDEAFNRLGDAMGDAVFAVWEDGMDGFMKTFRDFVKSINKMVVDMLAQMAADSLKNFLFSGSGGGLIGSFFGGGGGGAAGGGATAKTSNLTATEDRFTSSGLNQVAFQGQRTNQPESINVSVPVNIEGGGENKQMIGELQRNIEEVVVKTIKEFV